MIKIINETGKGIPTKRASSIETGQTFIGKIGSYGGLFLKSYQEVLFLEDLRMTWTGNVLVENYQPVDLEIHVK